MSDKNKKEKNSSGFAPWRWIRRMFMGASKDLAQDDVFSVEKLESPSKMAVKAFFRRKLAVVALVILILLFLLVFIGPYFFPMDMNFTDANQANIGPTMSMKSVPWDMRDQIRMIDGYANCTVGVSEDNTLYIWGYTKNALTKVDYAAFPDEIREGHVLTASTGSDHIIAITTEGKVVGWGDKNRGQYGSYPTAEADSIAEMPEELRNGTIDVSAFNSLDCGYQATALVVGGKLYIWGNMNNYENMKSAITQAENGKLSSGVKKAVLSNKFVYCLMEDGSVIIPGRKEKSLLAKNTDGESVKLKDAMKGRTAVDIATTKSCCIVLLDDGEVLIIDSAKYGEDQVVLPTGTLSNGEPEKLVSLAGGAYHVVGISNANKAYAWGSDDKGQCQVSGVSCTGAFAGAYQTYLVESNGSAENAGSTLVKSIGLRGYLFGTDGQGRDTFTRIVHGGKMTMTIGAVAVIVSSVIAIIVGCLSGYFGGWVDMILMRVTEIFSAIPFLPFAMMLSYVMSTKPISETMRIFIIMLILGLLSWTGLARMIRGQVLAEREKEFVMAAKAMGVREKRIAFKHILPNVVSVILVSMTLDFAGCLLTESSLSYLGFGVQQPRPTWGNMLNGANNSVVIQNYWWQWLFPAIFLSIATICINVIGDTLRDVLDPKSSQEK